MSPLKAFLLGALSMSAITAAVFFLRFWRSSHDRLFVFFAVAFAFLSIDWGALALAPQSGTLGHYMFLPRLTGFLLIIVGIIDKNSRTPQ